MVFCLWPLVFIKFYETTIIWQLTKWMNQELKNSVKNLWNSIGIFKCACECVWVIECVRVYTYAFSDN